MEATIEQIAELLEKTQHAHHQAYLATDGYDPDWPLWYAGYLLDKLPPLLQADMTKSELTYWMVLLSKQQPLAAPDESWAHYYANILVNEYL
jgi:hypothetical protein